MKNTTLSKNNFSTFDNNQILKNLDYEWLVTNGLGGYSSGTISGILNRRYHGLFITPQNPPLDRRYYVSKIEETIFINDKEFLLSANRWRNSEAIHPAGYQYIDSFFLDENIPTWIFRCDKLFIEKKIFMPLKKNQVYICYKVISHDYADIIPNFKIKCDLFVNNRNIHEIKKNPNIFAEFNSKDIEFFNENKEKIFESFSNMEFKEVKNITYINYELLEEKNRGFDYVEDHILGASFSSNLNIDEVNYIVINADKHNNVELPYKIINEIKISNKVIIDGWKEKVHNTPKWIEQLLYSVNLFIVNRAKKNNLSSDKTIIAGYHWFGDWGRDTMISLPGLCLATQQYHIAREILENYAQYIDQGMIPNRFPDNNHLPDYNTADATFWFFEAVFQYYFATKDLDFLKFLYPYLQKIIENHLKGTRYNIYCDPNDALIYAGENGTQLTWMDAKIGDYVVTPRVGKPIEINALWYNALTNFVDLCLELKYPHEKYLQISQTVKKNLLLFWNEELGYCYDVLNSKDGHDTSLRPNQIIALSLNHCPFSAFQKKSILDHCGRSLLTYYGLRSLSKDAKDYKGLYIGTPWDRDNAYHQGTVWGWLLGKYAIAFHNVTKNANVAISFLEPLEKHINQSGIGFISEIFDGNYPFIARGCIAQAWSVAETLNAWSKISKHLNQKIN
ncbi:amylo-alpha-1,6-glucosidase [Spirobacillus cienkowskii]|uniref:amylo-alpha-1,6-glucosidase n=1 Tax=Spirobacillus cienkowskii TaxID=495820 RepID=UPI0030D541D0